MTTTTTRAMQRSLNHALESAEGDSTKIAAINKDWAQWLQQDRTELFIIARLSNVPVRMAQMRALTAITEDASAPPLKALVFGEAIRAQIALGVACDIEC